MASGTTSLSREELYNKYNMPTAGQFFVAYLLPILEMAIQYESDIKTNTHDEVLAEVALWKAFDNEPKLRPFGIQTGLLLLYDYLYSLPFGVYGLSIVGLATILALIPSVQGRYLLAASHAGDTDEDGIPADLRMKAITVASSTVSLVFVAVGITVQMMATSGIVGAELLNQNQMAGGPIPPIVVICVILVSLYAYSWVRK